MKKFYKLYLYTSLACPNCGWGYRVPANIKDAISASNEFVCPKCATVFEIYLVAPQLEGANPVNETIIAARDEAERDMLENGELLDILRRRMDETE